MGNSTSYERHLSAQQAKRQAREAEQAQRKQAAALHRITVAALPELENIIADANYTAGVRAIESKCITSF